MTSISFPSLLALAGTPSTLLHRSGKTGHPRPALGLKEKPLVPLSLIAMLAVALHKWPLLSGGNFLLFHFVVSLLVMNGHRTLPGAFTASIEMTVVIFPWCINLHVLSQPYIPEENPTRSWHMILTHCSTWFASILLRIFICVHQRYWPIVFFLVSLSGVGIR